MTHFVKVFPQPIEVIDHTEKFAQAAWRLATENCAFVIPPYVRSNGAPVTYDEHKLEWLLTALNAIKPTWGTIEHSARRINYGEDIGMHGNPYQPAMLSPDFLHYHKTIEGTVTVTVAQARQAYLGESAAAMTSLTEALRRGETDTRYADPHTFQQAEIEPEGVVVFRLSEERSGLPLLHDFMTTSRSRVAEITGLCRL